MDIKPAQEQDIIDVLYLLKQEKDLACVPNTENPMPEYTTLKEEIDKGKIYLLEHQKISIGTFSLCNPAEEDEGEQIGTALQINRITIASYWINNETLGEILNFLEEYAHENRFTTLHFLINSRNGKMNTFYHNLGFTFLGQTSSPDDHANCNVYEKKLGDLS
ncbi:MAG: hypothetical protein KGY60_05295 [Bacteroidales bacterium]|nr:hypothetical protein [Bacteroidales bacterium]